MKLTMREKQIELVANFLMEEYGLKDWHLEFRRMTRSLGRCYQRTKCIKLSKYFIASKSYIRMTNTVLHEISHALTPYHHHDKIWREMAEKIGAIPKRSLSDAEFENKKEVI